MSKLDTVHFVRNDAVVEVRLDTVADKLWMHAEDDSPAFLHEDGTWSFREMVEEGKKRASLFEEMRDPDRPPHVGVLLDNVADYVFWLVGAALSGSVIVGINSTYRGPQLAQLIDHTDCQLIVTSSGFAELLDGTGISPTDGRVLFVDDPSYQDQLSRQPEYAGPANEIVPADLFLLIFTSGSTGLPKAVRCTQGRFANTGMHVASIAGLGADDVIYSPLPFFHSSSLFTGWSASLHAGIPLATRTRFSASRTTDDLRNYAATMMTYTGKVLNYILAVPEAANDGDVPVRLAVGNEASEQDIKTFAARFGCDVRDSYGSTEGVIIIRRDPSMPKGALGLAADTVKVLDPETGQECARARFDEHGKLTNFEDAVGEVVETEPSSGFEGYYRNEAATNERFRDGCYWSGDLAYRDADGWFFFAGRSNEWMRVDGENFAAAPVEAILGRHPDVRSVAVYAVPDDPVGDRVMVAMELHGDADFDAEAFDAFLQTQPDLGTKWIPAFVRIEEELPKLGSMKIDKTRLRREAWQVPDVLWRRGKGAPLLPLEDADRAQLSALLG